MAPIDRAWDRRGHDGFAARVADPGERPGSAAEFAAMPDVGRPVGTAFGRRRARRPDRQRPAPPARARHPDPDYIAALLERMVAAGTTYVRSHTDVDPEVGLDGVDAVRTAVARLDGRVDVEQVAFPQHGLLTNPGTAELLEEALRQGVETVGGIDPAGVDRDPVRHLDVLFDLAARYGAGIDVHLHDPDELGALELELIVDRTRDSGLAGRVTVSHAYGFSQMDAAHQDRLIERLAEAGVTLVTAAVYSFPVPPIKRLRAAGVNVACGHDGISRRSAHRRAELESRADGNCAHVAVLAWTPVAAVARTRFHPRGHCHPLMDRKRPEENPVSDYVTVARADNEAIAELIRQRLEQGGISCVLVPSDIAAVAGAGASYAVTVQPEKADEAKELLGE